MKTSLCDTLRTHFYAPLMAALTQADHTRNCPQFTDSEFLEAGVGRVISGTFTGRAWVQELQMEMGSKLSVSNFFKTLGSRRRLKLLKEVAEGVRLFLDRGQCPDDPLAEHVELNGFAVYGGDGHYEEHAAHALRIDGKAVSPATFYALNLRSHSLSLLDIARPVLKREHDITALKRLGSTRLRMGEPTGTKVIMVYDMASIDYRQWYNWKARGLYWISCEKSNSAAAVCGINQWDRQDKRNRSVEADELVGVFCGVLLRRITYRDPATQKQYVFMTSEMTLPPGLIAFLYKLRWDIEKTFDEKKNKLHEKKAWATSTTARSQQAYFISLAHNLMVLLEHHLDHQEGIRDEKTENKRRERMEHIKENLRQEHRKPNPMVVAIRRSTQRSLQFIRWLRHHLFSETSYSAAVDSLKPYMEAYIT